MGTAEQAYHLTPNGPGAGAERRHNVLLEGAQGALLDLDFGTYPMSRRATPPRRACAWRGAFFPVAWFSSGACYQRAPVELLTAAATGSFDGISATVIRNIVGVDHSRRTAVSTAAPLRGVAVEHTRVIGRFRARRCGTAHAASE